MNSAGAPVQPVRPGDPASLGRHRVVGRLGGGGMGVVYLAEGPFGRVAVKLVREELADDPEFRRRFQREVQACFRVGGSRTVRLVDFELDAARPWLATEFVDAPNLATHVRAHGPLPADEQVTLAAGLAEALVSIHAIGMIHRDLKPSNVLWTPHGPRVIDFGIAAAADAAGLTVSGQFVGTPGWHSPEQVSGREATAGADVFAWGALLCFAATAAPPFGSGPPQAVLHRVLMAEPSVDLDLLAPVLHDLVTSAMNRQPEKRPTAAEFFAQLAGSLAGPLAGSQPRLPPGSVGAPVTRVLETQPTPAPTPPWSVTVASRSEPADPPSSPAVKPAVEPVGRRRRRRSLIVAGMAVLVVLAAGVAVAVLPALHGDGSPDDTPYDTFTATEPWRIVIDDKIEGEDNGCTVTVSETDIGEGLTISEVYGKKPYQIPRTGTFRWDVNDPACIVSGIVGAGDATLPFAHEAYTGDTDAFQPPDPVLIEIIDFGGADECRLDLRDPADGQMLDFGTARPDEGTLSLDPGGRSYVYISEPTCGIRVHAD